MKIKDMIIKEGNDILTKVSTAIDNVKREELTDILVAMRNFVANPENKASGLALPQVGLNYRGFIFKNQGKPTIVINPTFKPKLNRKKNGVEGCLSIDNFNALVPRYTDIQVFYQDEQGKRIISFLKGFSAVCFQHELDHLNGLLISKYPKVVIEEESAV